MFSISEKSNSSFEIKLSNVEKVMWSVPAVSLKTIIKFIFQFQVESQDESKLDSHIMTKISQKKMEAWFKVVFKEGSKAKNNDLLMDQTISSACLLKLKEPLQL